jgi:hypothetical protein
MNLTCTGIFFRNVAYPSYDVPWFVEWMDYNGFKCKEFCDHSVDLTNSAVASPDTIKKRATLKKVL